MSVNKIQRFGRIPEWLSTWANQADKAVSKLYRRAIAWELATLASAYLSNTGYPDGQLEVNTAEIAAACGISYTTTYRLVQSALDFLRLASVRDGKEVSKGTVRNSGVVTLWFVTTNGTPKKGSVRDGKEVSKGSVKVRQCSILKELKSKSKRLDKTTPSAKPTLSAAVKNIWEHYLSKRIENNIRGTVSINPARARVIEKTLKIHSENRIKRAISAFLSPSSWHSQNKQYEIAFALRINRDTGADGVERYTPNWEDGREVRPEQDEIAQLEAIAEDWLWRNKKPSETIEEAEDIYRGEAAYSNLFHAFTQAKNRNR